MQLNWTASAIDDLVQARAFIGNHNVDAAQDFAERVLDCADNLIETPRMGRPGRIPALVNY